MKSKWTAAGLLGAMCLVMVLLFQNCGPSEYGLGGSRSPASLDCSDEFVCRENADHLWLHVNSTYPVFPRPTQDIGGDCNSGGYHSNVITSHVYFKTAGGVRVDVGAGAPTVCEEGRFRARVELCNLVANSPIHCDNLSQNNTFHVDLVLVGVTYEGLVVENKKYSASNRKTIQLDMMP